MAVFINLCVCMSIFINFFIVKSEAFFFFYLEINCFFNSEKFSSMMSLIIVSVVVVLMIISVTTNVCILASYSVFNTRYDLFLCLPFWYSFLSLFFTSLV